MTIEKRYVVGTLMLIPMLPLVLVGFVTYWLWFYAYAGYDIGERVGVWIGEKVN